MVEDNPCEHLEISIVLKIFLLIRIEIYEDTKISNAGPGNFQVFIVNFQVFANSR
jgi:hypothetical protein